MPTHAVQNEISTSSGLTLPVSASPRITTAEVPGSRPTNVANV